MTFHPLMAQAVEEVIPMIRKGPDVCEFGNQRNTADPSLSVKDWYMKKGFRYYTCLDMNTDKDAQIFDLNKSVHDNRGTSRLGVFDLVTNNGTSEHVFNQYMCFRNAHDLCKNSGIMLHCLPFTPWLNHGFYNYNPVLFRDLAGANDYKIKFIWIANRWGKKAEFGKIGSAIYHEKRPPILTEAVKSIMDGGDAFVTVAFMRTNVLEFRVPIQGKYQSVIQDEKMRKEYGL